MRGLHRLRDLLRPRDMADDRAAPWSLWADTMHRIVMGWAMAKLAPNGATVKSEFTKKARRIRRFVIVKKSRVFEDGDSTLLRKPQRRAQRTTGWWTNIQLPGGSRGGHYFAKAPSPNARNARSCGAGETQLREDHRVRDASAASVRTIGLPTNLVFLQARRRGYAIREAGATAAWDWDMRRVDFRIECECGLGPSGRSARSYASDSALTGGV